MLKEECAINRHQKFGFMFTIYSKKGEDLITIKEISSV